MNSNACLQPSARDISNAQLLAVFTRLLSLQPFRPWKTRARSRGFYDRLWSPLITLWYLVWQRLQQDPTLDAVVKNARQGGADALCSETRKLSSRLRSRATTAFSNARQRLPLPWIQSVFRQWTTLLCGSVPAATWHGLHIGLLDGSTVRLRPLGNIPKRFAPATNQHGRSYWCVMRVVVAFCATTGLALATGYGPQSVSEQTLAVSLLLRAGGSRLWVGDRNFGIWRLARAAVQAHSHLLVRLTEVRARRLLGRALPAALDEPICWTPTRHDQAQASLQRLPVPGRLLVVRLSRPGFRSHTLYLFTTLTDVALYPVEELLALYGGRWQVELNLRDLKSQMHLAQLEVKSARMALKQWMAGLLAYNLIRGVMLWAATVAAVNPLTLSFAQSRRLIIDAVRDWQRGGDPRLLPVLWEQLLADVAATQPPKRRKKRPQEPRATRRVPQVFPALKGSRTDARSLLQTQSLKS